MDLRKHKRFRVCFPVSFSGDVEGEGMVYNIGQEGCKISSKPPLFLGAQVKLCLLPSGQDAQDGPITIVLAVVRWATEEQGGLEFLYVGVQGEKRLRQLLADLETALQHEQMPASSTSD